MHSILLFILYATIAASFTLAKMGLAYAPPIFFVAFRMLIAGFIFLFGEFLRTKKWPTCSYRDIPLFLVTSFFHIYFSFICDLIALQDMSSFKGAFLYSFSPFIAIFFSYFYFSETVTLKKLVGLGIGFGGFMYELLSHTSPESLDCLGSFVSRADLIMLAAVISSLYGWTLVRMLIHKGYSSACINGYTMLIGGAGAFLTSGLTENIYPMPVTHWYPFLIITAILIIVGNIISYGLYGYLLQFYTTTFLAFAGMLSPTIAALFGYFFLQESITISFFISTATVALGLFLFYSEEMRQGYIKK